MITVEQQLATGQARDTRNRLSRWLLGWYTGAKIAEKKYCCGAIGAGIDELAELYARKGPV